jgi:hypothetical protein
MANTLLLGLAMGTRNFHTPVEHRRINASIRSPNMPRMVRISWLGAAARNDELHGHVSFPQILFSFSIESPDETAGLLGTHDIAQTTWFSP